MSRAPRPSVCSSASGGSTSSTAYFALSPRGRDVRAYRLHLLAFARDEPPVVRALRGALRAIGRSIDGADVRRGVLALAARRALAPSRHRPLAPLARGGRLRLALRRLWRLARTRLHDRRKRALRAQRAPIGRARAPLADRRTMRPPKNATQCDSASTGYSPSLPYVRTPAERRQWRIWSTACRSLSSSGRQTSLRW
jgi:hypothetical protein